MNIKGHYTGNELDDVVGQILLDEQWREMSYLERLDLIESENEADNDID